MSKAVNKKSEGALANVDLNALLKNSFDNIDSQSVSMPYFKVVAKQSDVIEPGSANYIESAKPGMILNSALGQVFDKIRVIPSYFYVKDLEWADRESGTNRPVGSYDVSENIVSRTTKDERGKDRLENGNYIERTAHHFVTRLDENNNVLDNGIITMSRTQFKKSQRWNTMQLAQYEEIGGKRQQLPNHAQIYTLSTTLEKNNLGTWYGWVINYAGMAPAEAIQRSVAFRESASKMQSVSDAGESATAKTETAGVTTSSSQGKEETPF